MRASAAEPGAARVWAGCQSGSSDDERRVLEKKGEDRDGLHQRRPEAKAQFRVTLHSAHVRQESGMRV